MTGPPQTLVCSVSKAGQTLNPPLLHAVARAGMDVGRLSQLMVVGCVYDSGCLYSTVMCLELVRQAFGDNLQVAHLTSMAALVPGRQCNNQDGLHTVTATVEAVVDKQVQLAGLSQEFGGWGELPKNRKQPRRAGACTHNQPNDT